MGHEEFYTRIDTAISSILLRLFKSGALSIKLKIGRPAGKIPWPIESHCKLTREEQYLQRLCSFTMEVIGSYEALRGVEVYLSRLPFTRAGIAPSKYIRFQIESFFNEMYILYERMKKFTIRIGREFRKDPGAAPVDERVKYVLDEINRIFEPLLELRNTHVHEERYDDAELNRLELLEMLAKKDPKTFEPHIRRATRAAHANALKFVKNTNTGLSAKLDLFFEFFEGLLFKKDGSIRLPTNIGPA